MIFDRLEHADTYLNVLPGLARALTHLRTGEVMDLPAGRHAVPGGGDDVFLIMDRFTPRTDEEQMWESHRNYADLQVMLSGYERQGWLALSTGPAVKTPYDPQRDAAFYHPPAAGPTPQWLTLRTGFFSVFLPHDVHAPSLRVVESDDTPVVKAVYKIAVG